jgi:GTP-binding protein Era
VQDLFNDLLPLIPEGPKMFPPDQLSDRTTRFFAEEIIREQAFLLLKEEVPYSLAVQIQNMKEEERITRIQAVLFVERDTQKGIIVGKGGSMIKAIGTAAREQLEEFLGTQVYLELWAKVSKRWRKNESRLKEFGYIE